MREAREGGTHKKFNLADALLSTLRWYCYLNFGGKCTWVIHLYLVFLGAFGHCLQPLQAPLFFSSSFVVLRCQPSPHAMPGSTLNFFFFWLTLLLFNINTLSILMLSEWWLYFHACVYLVENTLKSRNISYRAGGWVGYRMLEQISVDLDSVGM
ncbi:hypothetical protein DFH27DRAFT_535900 [Peziza echinospora]|nr:hypothetical protein DFH27DRAFT_535900 [Peziza echinospora]